MGFSFTLFSITLLLIASLRRCSGLKPVNFRSSRLYTTRRHNFPNRPGEASNDLRILLIVEPTPFTYISGYANRFQELMKTLRKTTNDIVHVITPDRKERMSPTTFANYSITTLEGFELFCYRQVYLSFDLKLKMRDVFNAFKPDLVHVTMPSTLCVAAIFWAKLSRKPLVISYHTDLLQYARAYFKFPAILPLLRLILRLPLIMADVVLCTSPQLQQQLRDVLKIDNVHVWRKGVDTEVFIAYDCIAVLAIHSNISIISYDCHRSFYCYEVITVIHQSINHVLSTIL